MENKHTKEFTMPINFNLIRKEDESKVPFTVRLYSTTIEEIVCVATAEKISAGSFVRHAINNALIEYARQLQSEQTQTEVK